MKRPRAVHLRIGMDAVRGARLRNFWTMFGVIVGVASVITIVGIGQGIKRQIGGQIHHLGQNLVVVRPAQLSTGTATSASSLTGLAVSSTLGPKDISTIAHTRGVAANAPLTITGSTVTGDHGTYRQGFVIGTSSDLPSLLNQSLAYGGFFNNDTSNNTAVIGQHASQALFNEDVPLGRSFTFHGQQFVVTGIFNQFTTSPLSQQADFNNAIFIPNDMAESLTNQTAPTYEILVRPDSSTPTGTLVKRLQARLDAAHGGASGLSVQSANQDVAASNGILELLTRLIAGVAAISLVVGGIGIMNVMLVSVSERMHEIGIRKAIGATNGQIMNQFLVEAAVLSASGGVIGIILAFVIDLLLRAFTNLTPVISWPIVVIASGVSLLTGVIFGTIPAVKAAHKNPIDALRSE
jgi:putative ABC transport system permease protein